MPPRRLPPAPAGPAVASSQISFSTTPGSVGTAASFAMASAGFFPIRIGTSLQQRLDQGRRRSRQPDALAIAEIGVDNTTSECRSRRRSHRRGRAREPDGCRPLEGCRESYSGSARPASCDSSSIWLPEGTVRTSRCTSVMPRAVRAISTVICSPKLLAAEAISEISATAQLVGEQYAVRDRETWTTQNEPERNCGSDSGSDLR